jgi:hypothetical protein
MVDQHETQTNEDDVTSQRKGLGEIGLHEFGTDAARKQQGMTQEESM